MAGWLWAARPEAETELVPVTTLGDARRRSPIEALGERGVFVKAVQVALLEDRADIAVHSLKDLPTEPVPLLTTAAVPERGDPRDALVAGRCPSLEALPAGARIGTSSVRRRAQGWMHLAGGCPGHLERHDPYPGGGGVRA